MTKNIRIILTGLAVLVVALFGVNLAKAQGSFWDRVAQVLGNALADKIEIPSEVRFTGSSPVFGAAGDINRTARVISKSISSRTATTSVQMPSVTTTIDRVIFFAQGDGTTVTSAIHMALSTNSTTVGTDLTVSSTFAGGSAFSWATTSTFPTISQRQAAPNSWVLCYTEDGQTPTTTQGYCAVEYFVP